MLLEIAIALAVTTFALSTGQAWAMAAGRDRGGRYLLVWIAGTALAIVFAAPSFGFPLAVLRVWNEPLAPGAALFGGPVTQLR